MIVSWLIEAIKVIRSIPESPYRRVIRNLRVKGDPSKLLKTQSVNESVFKRRVAQIIEVLENQAIQRCDNRKGRMTLGRILLHGFAQALKPFTINKPVDFLKEGVSSAFSPTIECVV